jgi:hypothetical protein
MWTLDGSVAKKMNAACLTRQAGAGGDPARMVEALVDEINDPATGLVTCDLLRVELAELEGRLTSRIVTLLGCRSSWWGSR